MPDIWAAQSLAPTEIFQYQAVGEMQNAFFGRGITSTDDLEVHLILQDHGPAIDGRGLAVVSTDRGGRSDASMPPSLNIANQMLIRKTIVSRNVLETREKTVEIAGGAGYLRSVPLEGLLREALAPKFYPLTKKQQLVFSRRLPLRLELAKICVNSVYMCLAET